MGMSGAGAGAWGADAAVGLRDLRLVSAPAPERAGGGHPLHRVPACRTSKDVRQWGGGTILLADIPCDLCGYGKIG